MRLDEYAACDATELASLISSGQVAPEEVRRAALEALAEVDPHLNAVVHGPFEDAGYDPAGRFAGVPFAIKDTLGDAGRPLEFGSRLLSGIKAQRDSTLTERFRGAGLVNLVRSATPEFAFNVDTAPVAHGPTRNPWALERSPGGSSGGAAALVAARVLPMAHGNDGGGSIRLPAAWCGLVGLKPSRGRVPGGPLIGEVPGGTAHEFALTRSVRDAAGLLDEVCGPAPGDRYYVQLPPRAFRDAAQSEPPRLRVALHHESYWGRPTDPDVRAVVEDAARALEELGHSVEPASAPVDAERLRRAHLVLWPWLLALTANGFAALAGREVSEQTVEAASLACIRHGKELGVGEAWRAFAIQNATSRAWGEFLDDYDVFLCPTAPTGPPAAGVPAQRDPRYDSAEAWIDEVFSYTPYTPLANTTGQPSISLPLGCDGEGMPVGVMLTAQTLREDLLLALAAQLERARPWRERRPPICAGAPIGAGA